MQTDKVTHNMIEIKSLWYVLALKIASVDAQNNHCKLQLSKPVSEYVAPQLIKQ